MPVHTHLPVAAVKDYRNILLELVISYLLKQPSDYLDFALEFFIEKRKQAETSAQVEAEEDSITSACDDERQDFIYGGKLEQTDFDDLPVHPKTEETKEKLMKSLDTIFIFQFLDKSQMSKIIDSMEKQVVEKGDILIRQGDEGDYFYAIERGYYQAYLEKGGRKTVMKTFADVGAFGELALMYDQPRACCVRALTPGRVYTIGRATFRKIVEGSTRERRRLLGKAVSKVPHLKTLSEEECQALVDNQEYRTFPAGATVFTQGQPDSEELFFVVRGVAEATRVDDHGDQEIRRYSVGDHFGATSFFRKTPRAMTVITVTELHTAVLRREKFHRLFGSYLMGDSEPEDTMDNTEFREDKELSNTSHDSN